MSKTTANYYLRIGLLLLAILCTYAFVSFHVDQYFTFSFLKSRLSGTSHDLVSLRLLAVLGLLGMLPWLTRGWLTWWKNLSIIEAAERLLGDDPRT